MREHQQRAANRDHDEVEKKEVEKEEGEKEEGAETKFAGGKPPPVSDKFDGAGGGATQLAYEESDDKERELKEKVSKLIATRFEGDYRKAFDHYDKDKDGTITKGELVRLLSDAGVGNAITRPIWAGKIIERLDRNIDDAIAWHEFDSVFRVHS
jgi:hypothetical protein